jgi:hypothetical protein
LRSTCIFLSCALQLPIRGAHLLPVAEGAASDVADAEVVDEAAAMLRVAEEFPAPDAIGGSGAGSSLRLLPTARVDCTLPAASAAGLPKAWRVPATVVEPLAIDNGAFQLIAA